MPVGNAGAPQPDAVKPGVQAGSAPPAATCAGRPVEPQLRRMTRLQFQNSVRDLLNVTVDDVASLPPDDHQGSFASNIAAELDPVSFERYVSAIEALAAKATKSLEGLLGCSSKEAQDACTERFVTVFGARALRRPLEAGEKARLTALAAAAKVTGGHEVAVRTVIEALLLSPHFLYIADPDHRAQVGPRGNAVAARLSYFLWQSTPDQELMEAAGRGDLDRSDGVARQARRMLDDRRAQTGVLGFFPEWLDLGAIDRPLEKDPKLFPMFDDAMQGAMRGEASRFVGALLSSEQGTLKTLLTGPHVFQSPALKGFEKVALPGTERLGVLTQPAFLAVHSGPVHSSIVLRGKVIREGLLCQIPPPPTVDVDDVAMITDKVSGQDLSKQRLADATCGACHRLMDPLGTSFEGFDAIGRSRDKVNGKTIDLSGELLQSDVDGKYRGPGELMAKLAGSAQVGSCMVTQAMRYALARNDDPTAACSHGQVLGELRASGLNIRQLFVSVATGVTVAGSARP
jgi:hypothetical protein